MRAALVNLSPKAIIRKTDPCMSHRILADVKRYLRHYHVHDMEDFHFKTGAADKEKADALFSCDVWILSYPLYAGGVPSHMLQLMENLQAEAEKRSFGSIQVYAVAHCGLYEGMQAHPSLRMVSTWCQRAGFLYGGGISVGGAGMYAPQLAARFGFGRGRSFVRRLAAFCEVISEKKTTLNSNCAPDVSKKAFVMKMNRRLRTRVFPGTRE